MKISKIIVTFFLVFNCAAVLAEGSRQSENTSVFVDHYGIVSAIYSNESRIVIDDTSLQYKYGSIFYNAQGKKFSNIKQSIAVGDPVVFHYYQKKSNLILKDVKVVSMQKVKKVRETSLQLF